MWLLSLRLQLLLLGRRLCAPPRPETPAEASPLESSKREMLEFITHKKPVGAWGLGLFSHLVGLEFTEGKIGFWMQGASEGAVTGGWDGGIEKR